MKKIFLIIITLLMIPITAQAAVNFQCEAQYTPPGTLDVLKNCTLKARGTSSNPVSHQDGYFKTTNLTLRSITMANNWTKREEVKSNYTLYHLTPNQILTSGEQEVLTAIFEVDKRAEVCNVIFVTPPRCRVEDNT